MHINKVFIWVKVKNDASKDLTRSVLSEIEKKKWHLKSEQSEKKMSAHEQKKVIHRCFEEKICLERKRKL